MNLRPLSRIVYAFVVAVAVPLVVYAAASIPADCATPGDCADLTPTFKNMTVKGMASSSVVGSLGASMGTNAPVIRDNYVYYISSDSKFTVADISDPANPVVVGQTTPSSAFANPVQGPVLAGRYAYVVNNTDQNLHVFDVSDPSNPVLMRVENYYTGYPSTQVVHGKYLYVGGGCCGGYPVNVFDISDPMNRIFVASAGTTGVYAYNLIVAGDYLYYVSANALQVVDIRSAGKPVLLGSVSITGAGGYSNVIKVIGRYAYVTARTPDKLFIVDVSDGNTPTIVGSVSTTDTPQGIVVEGKYAYIAQDNGVAVYDVSDVAAPTYVGLLTTTAATGLAVSGRYAVTTAGEVLDLGSTYVQNMEAGGVATDTLTVAKAATFQDSMSVYGGLTVGSLGMFSTGPVGISTQGGGTDVFSVTAGVDPTPVAKTQAFSAATFTNRATSTTASLIKSGVKISSTGSWTGASAANIGLYVSSVVGGTKNYDAIFNGGGNVGVGTLAPKTTLEVVGTMSGSVLNLSNLMYLRPRSAAPSAPSAGSIYYDSDSNELCLYDGSSWVGLKAAGSCM